MHAVRQWKKSDNKCKTGLENWIQLISLELRGRPGISVNTRQWHSVRQYYADKEKLSQEFGIWKRGAIQWAWTINSVKLTQTQTDTAASPGKCWSQTSNESRFSFFFLFLTSFQCRTFFFRFCFVYSRTIFLFTKSNLYPVLHIQGDT